MTEQEASEIRANLLDIARLRLELGIAPEFANEIIRRLTLAASIDSPTSLIEGVEDALSLLSVVAFAPGRSDAIRVLSNLSEICGEQHFVTAIFVDDVTARSVSLPDDLPVTSSDEAALRHFVNQRGRAFANEFQTWKPTSTDRGQTT